MSVARKQRVKTVIPGLQAATQEGGMFSFFKSGAHSVKDVFSASRAHERSPDDALCEKADDYALKLEQELTTLEGHLEMLMKREKNVARTWVELGMACGVISQMESAVNEKVNVSVFQVLGSMSDQIAVMTARKVELEKQGFTDAVKVPQRCSASHPPPLSPANRRRALSAVRIVPGSVGPHTHGAGRADHDEAARRSQQQLLRAAAQDGADTEEVRPRALSCALVPPSLSLSLPPSLPSSSAPPGHAVRGV